MAGLIHINTEAAITPDNLWHNFIYLEDYLRALASDAALIQGVSLSTDFQEAVAGVLATDLNTFIPNLADGIYNQTDFLERIVNEDSSVGGDFDGLAYNITFLQNLVTELADNPSFIAAFVEYIQTSAPEFFEALANDVFKGYFGPDLSYLTFAAPIEENGVPGVYGLWLTTDGQPNVTGDNSTSYVGLVCGYEDDISDINLFISRDSSFAKDAVLPDDVVDPATDVLRFTPTGVDNTSGQAVGDIAQAFFDSDEGHQLLDISSLTWDGLSNIYIKLMGTKSNLSYIRIGFDYTTHASQVTERETVGNVTTNFSTVVIDSQGDFIDVFGAEGNPAASVYYNSGNSRIEIPQGIKVLIGTINPQDSGASGAGVFDGGYAYKMWNPVYILGDNIQFIGQAKVTIVKGADDAIFKSVAPRSEAASHNYGDHVRKITITGGYGAGDYAVGDVIYYSDSDEYYIIEEVDEPSNFIYVDRDLPVGTASGTVTKLYKNLFMEGFTFDGRGGILDGHASPAIKTGDNSGNKPGGGFAHLIAFANSRIDVRILNCKAKSGGALYLDRCINIQVPNIQYCEVEPVATTEGGLGGAIYGGHRIVARAWACNAVKDVVGGKGGAYSNSKRGILYAYDCTAGEAGFESFDTCIEPVLLQDRNNAYETNNKDIIGDIIHEGSMTLRDYDQDVTTGRFFSKLGQLRQTNNRIVINEAGDMMPNGTKFTLSGPRILRARINTSTGAIDKLRSADSDADDLILVNNNDDDIAGVELKTDKVWQGVWNDYADFQELLDKLIYGKCYYDTEAGAKLCSKRCQYGIIGIASDTFGNSVGSNPKKKQVSIAVAGWTLAIVDNKYPVGTVLVNNKDGNLTKARWYERILFSERCIAIYKKKEINKMWGTEDKKISVNNRHWVKLI